jgi:hypothetical protein
MFKFLTANVILILQNVGVSYEVFYYIGYLMCPKWLTIKKLRDRFSTTPTLVYGLRYISPKAISPKGRFTEKLARIMNNSAQNYIFGEMAFGEMSGYPFMYIELSSITKFLLIKFKKFKK